MSVARALIDAEDPKDFMKRVLRQGWRVVPIEGPSSTYAVTLYLDGQEVHNVIIDDGKQHAPELEAYLNWLQSELPYSDIEWGKHWIPDGWIQRADELGLPERYIKQTGKAAYKRSGKTGLGRATDPDAPPSEPPGQIWASMVEGMTRRRFLDVLGKVLGATAAAPAVLAQGGHAQAAAASADTWEDFWMAARAELLNDPSDLEYAAVLRDYSAEGRWFWLRNLQPNQVAAELGRMSDAEWLQVGDRSLVKQYWIKEFGPVQNQAQQQDRQQPQPQQQQPQQQQPQARQDIDQLVPMPDARSRFDYAGGSEDVGYSRYAEAEDPKSVFRKAIDASVLTPDKIREARRRIKEHYGTLSFSFVTLEAASLRTGTEHEEDIVNDLPVCRTCGPIEDNNLPKVDPIYHPELWITDAANKPIEEAEDPKSVFKAITPDAVLARAGFEKKMTKGKEHWWITHHDGRFGIHIIPQENGIEYHILRYEPWPSSATWSVLDRRHLKDWEEVYQHLRGEGILEAEDPKAFLKRTAPRPKWLIKAETTNGRVFMEKTGRHEIISWHTNVSKDTAQYEDEEQALADIQKYLKPEIVERHMIVPFQLTPENIKAENVYFSEAEDPKSFLRRLAPRQLSHTGKPVRLDDIWPHLGDQEFDGLEVAPIVIRQEQDGEGTYEDRPSPGEDLTNAQWWIFAHLVAGGITDAASYPTRLAAEREASRIGQLKGIGYFVDMPEAEDPKRFLQHYGRDFVYTFDGTIYYVTPMNDQATAFLAAFDELPHQKLKDNQTVIIAPQYWQQLLALIGEAGLSGRRVNEMAAEDPKSVLRAAAANKTVGWQIHWTDRNRMDRVSVIYAPTQHEAEQDLVSWKEDSVARINDVVPLQMVGGVIMRRGQPLYQEAEDPKTFLKQRGDYVVKWAFGEPPDTGGLGGYRYRIVRAANGPQDAIEKWKHIDRILLAKAPPDKPPKIVKVYRYTDALAREKKLTLPSQALPVSAQPQAGNLPGSGGIAEPGGVEEAENPLSVLRAASAARTPEMTLLQVGFQRQDDMSFWKEQKRTAIRITPEQHGKRQWFRWTSFRRSAEGWAPLRSWNSDVVYRDWQSVANRLAYELMESKADDIAKEADKAEQPKSPEEAEAGNYKKGHIHLHGWAIAIENAKDSIRKSKDPDNPWQVTMPAHYGYIKGTVGKDKDHIDVYIGEHPTSMLAFVVNQQKEKGGFDEHKIMLGFKSKDEAIAAYDKAFNGDLGPKLRKSVVSATIDQVKHWLEKGDPKKEFAVLEESEARSVIDAELDEAEDPKHFLKRVAPHKDPITERFVKISMLPIHGDLVVKRVPVKWEGGRVMGREGWKAGINLHEYGLAKRPEILDVDQWESVLETVEYHIMEGPPDPNGYIEYEEPDDPWPLRELSWTYIGSYELDQQKMTEFFGLIPHRR